MASANPPNDDGTKDKDKQPSTPRRASAINKTSPKRAGNNGVATPANRKTSNGQLPKSAPAAAPGTNGIRKSSSSKKPAIEPTLLGDFFLGRPSPARRAAARRKSVDNTAVRQELRQQMREQAVRRVQQPGRVQSRVKDWQKKNAAAMATGNPEDTPSEPTEIAVHVDEESVTEEDRVRIKYREKARRRSSAAKKEEKPKESTPVDSRPNGPPKKRVVSDDNWMKRAQANAAVKPAVATAKKTPLFQKSSKPLTMQDKIKDWAKQIEVPESPAPPKIPKNPKPAKEYATKCGATITVEEEHAKASTVKSSLDQDVITVEEEASTNLSSSRTWKTESGRSGDDGIRVRPVKDASPHTSGDERLRVKPTRNKARGNLDDGIRVRPIKVSPLPDDGIRVRPMANQTGRTSSPRRSSSERPKRVQTTNRDRTPTGRDRVVQPQETEAATPTREPKRRVSPKTRRRATAPTVTEISTTLSDDEESWTSDDYDSQDDSDRPSSAPAKSLAEVPFGNSAFSELDLPVGADHHHFKRPKIQRNTSSFGAVPKAFRKIVTGAKEIVQVAAEPPKPVVNQPPSIEKWLHGTVDPFVENPPPKRNSLEKDWKQDVRRRSSAEKPMSPTSSSPAELQTELPRRDQEMQGRTAETELKPPVGLKRSKATRVATSPPKQATVKIPLREALNNLFRGESTGHKVIPKAYSSYQDTEVESESDFTDLNSYMEHVEQNNTGDPHVRSIDPEKRSPPSPESSYLSTEVSSSTEGPYMTPALPKHRPPPTNGQYELSTIVSEGSESTLGSDTMSVLSDSTVTQTTALTRSSAISRRNKGSGSRRRFTKHSDLISVLSLPDSEGGLVRASSIKSTSSLRRRTSNLEKVTVDDLLKEFAIDEDLYRRELKTLVDGAVPVLLRQVVESKDDYAADLFGPSSDSRADSMGKAVVNMGIALEKLRNLHKRSPTNDVNKILTWVLAAYPIYDRYLDVWRLGFEGIVVNLAPAPNRLDDEDSLVNAMPRNESGDVVDEKGQPVDLQRLLTRPLARVRGLLKLLRGARAIGVKHPELELVIEDFTELQQKARRRHREETARKTDEDASNTDTSRCCDLRMLKVIEGVLIDPSRQVNAKDFFSLDLAHSSGQRLECQVELVFRDKPKDPMDKGDVLIRDTGHARFCLLFPPVPKTAISARRGDGPGALVVMIRGRHNGKEWYELLTLTTDLDEQVLDWLDILGTQPVPPATTHNPASDLAPSPIAKVEVNAPFGERTARTRLRKSRQDMAPSRAVSAAEDQPKSSPPKRYHVRHASSPSTPTTPPDVAGIARHTPSPERTPTQTSFERTAPNPLPVLPSKPETTSLREDMRPDPKKLTKSPPNSTPFRDDGAPRPPVHRTLSSDKPAPLSPPVELAPAARIRRRGSSPLKHEYRPSDVSSESSESDSDSASDYDSSSDELDEADVPDTQPAISIKQTSEVSMSAIESVVESVVSENSITPSHSASQVGLYGQLGPGAAKDPEYIIKSIASISYWSNKKGQWAEAWEEACSIVITPGLVEAYPISAHSAPAEGALNSSGSSEFGGDADLSRMQPLLALELTPVVMIRQSTVIDLEIRSPVRPYCKLATIDAKIFRFRAPSAAEGSTLYMAVHKARLNNAKYQALAEDARLRSFGQPQATSQDQDGQSSSSHRRSWFGRKNSYRASTRAPSQSMSQSQGTSSSISAPSLLKRLTGGGSAAFNIDKSSVDRRSMQSRPTTAAGSLYTSASSSSGGNMTPPRSPSISTAEASGRTVVLGSDNLKVRCHLLVTSTKWEDHGNCMLQITRPPPGMRQELRIRHGMEKRVIVTKIPKKNLFGGSSPEGQSPLIVLDVVLGSKCFGRLGTRGIILNVWEDLRDEQNNVGLAPKTGGLSGTVRKWCFQCGSATEANWIFGLVAQEVCVGGLQ
ncbi:hypothetical protein N0V93_007119 [Gnomoniopsis smithogilvyi]|uniref:Uncharacterized protein n=1 Tax=Gnomoniopsis smithogilvyi TaxID=1191159 RepID=A0A9W9CWC4_9PEZI|nr:hypothetical protein N0V93_007119 [Gnomoniopsis smithogilvyi]